MLKNAFQALHMSVNIITTNLIKDDWWSNSCSTLSNRTHLGRDLSPLCTPPQHDCCTWDPLKGHTVLCALPSSVCQQSSRAVGMRGCCGTGSVGIALSLVWYEYARVICMNFPCIWVVCTSTGAEKNCDQQVWSLLDFYIFFRRGCCLWPTLQTVNLKTYFHVIDNPHTGLSLINFHRPCVPSET